jgi:hypothetical protein
VEQALARLEMQLARLKKDQTLLQELAARNAELEQELKCINDQITKLTGEVASLPAAKTGAVPKSKPIAKSRRHAAGGRPRLAVLIVACLKKAKGRPLTVRQLTDETLKRGFTTACCSPYKVVESRIQDLSKKGLLYHAKGQPGWLLGKANHADGTPRHVPHSKKSDSAGKPPLRQHILDALQRSKRPMSLKELCQCVLGAGYRTASSDFANVLGVALKKMSNVRRIPGQGYVLKGDQA